MTLNPNSEWLRARRVTEFLLKACSKHKDVDWIGDVYNNCLPKAMKEAIYLVYVHGPIDESMTAEIAGKTLELRELCKSLDAKGFLSDK